MKKYRIITTYVGSIGLEIEAENKEKAEKKANEVIEGLDDLDFLHELDPQFDEIRIEEI